MSSRVLTSSTHRGAGRQSAQRGSWRRSGTATTSSDTGREGEKGQHSKGVTRTVIPRARPTHFLSLPLGNHPTLRSRVQEFTDGLLLADPPIPGLDKSIIVQPSRLHITLGVMALTEDHNIPGGASGESEVQLTGTGSHNSSEPQDTPPTKTVSEALSLLHGLSERIKEVLETREDASSGSGMVMVPLNTMGVFGTGKKQSAHVLWVGPTKSRETTALDKVSDLVNKAFRDNGFITEKLPLKLHCTILNTKYRKGGGRRRPVPFSTEAIFSSDAYRNLMHAPSESLTTNQVLTLPHGALVECGAWPVDEIQLCQMVGRDPVTGAYISIGSLKLS